MSKSNLQINLEYLIARSLLAVFGWLPLGAALFVGSGLGRCAYYFSSRLRRTGLRNLELAFPELDQKERGRWLRGSGFGLAQYRQNACCRQQNKGEN